LVLLAGEIEKLIPKTIVEIGTANGGTLFMSTRLAADNALIISIDLPGGEFGGGYPDWKIPIYKSFAKANQTIELIRGDSHSEQTFEKLKSLLNGREIDYLFIDGDHTYDGVKKDFEKYQPLVKKNGIIALHDIVVHKGSKCDVHRFWNEVKQNYEYQEFVKDWNQNCFGIGVIKNN
jgi:predicted O-methyltransferase YrrM